LGGEVAQLGANDHHRGAAVGDHVSGRAPCAGQTPLWCWPGFSYIILFNNLIIVTTRAEAMDAP
jgi:hypothetical protein